MFSLYIYAQHFILHFDCTWCVCFRARSDLACAACSQSIYIYTHMWANIYICGCVYACMDAYICIRLYMYIYIHKPHAHTDLLDWLFYWRHWVQVTFVRYIAWLCTPQPRIQLKSTSATTNHTTTPHFVLERFPTTGVGVVISQRHRHHPAHPLPPRPNLRKVRNPNCSTVLVENPSH